MLIVKRRPCIAINVFHRVLPTCNWRREKAIISIYTSDLTTRNGSNDTYMISIGVKIISFSLRLRISYVRMPVVKYDITKFCLPPPFAPISMKDRS